MDWIEYLNDKLHQEPFDFVVDGVYWWLVLVVVCPVAGIFKLLFTIYEFCLYLLGLHNPSIETPRARNNDEEQLAVVITGCDTGFGQELAYRLVSMGFIVFCGCLQKESFQQFEGEPLAIPLKMDVTDDKEIAEAAETVSNWLKEENAEGQGKEKDSTTKQRRHLHAIVNNAGIAHPGLIDWNEISDFQRVMDVNFFGIMRCVKAFLPILKHQAANKIYSDARVINMVSCAGLITPMTFSASYGTSKWAAEALTANMRQELAMFGIHVTGFNPTFHDTSILERNNLAKYWDSLSEQTKEEYGKEYGEIFSNVKVRLVWKSRVVVNEMAKCLLLKKPPAKILVGSDAKLIVHFLSKLPLGLFMQMMTRAKIKPPTPAMMTK